MKNIIIRVYKWIIISVSLQLLVLILIDAHFFSNADTIATPEYIPTTKPMVEGKINIPEDAINIKISYDKIFASYMLNNKLIITDLTKKKDVKEISNLNKEITYYRWMNDRNTLIYATKYETGTNCEVEVTTIDVENEKERVLPKITKQSMGTQINAIEFSHVTNMIYAKLVANKVEKIYSFDIMNQMDYVTETSLGSIMKQANYTDNLFIDDEKGKIKFWSGTRKSINTLNISERCVLLGLSSKDEVFIGVLSKNNLVESIKKGKIEQSGVKTWEDINLDSSKEVDNFIVTEEGKIFYNDIKISTIFQVAENLNQQYDGKFVEIKGDTLITQLGNKLKITKLQ